MGKLATKKNILVAVSGIITLIVLVCNNIGNYRLCGGKQWGECVDILAGIELTFLPFFPLFFFSLVTYFMKEEVFQSWFRFARVYIPVSMLFIVLAPSYSSNWMFPYDKGMAAVIFSGAFVIISIINIIMTRSRLVRV